MVCLPNTDFCMDYGWLCILGIIVIFAIFVIFLAIKAVGNLSQTSDEGVSHRVVEGNTTDTPGHDQEEETSTPKAGSTIVFDTNDSGLECVLRITSVDEEESVVYGRFFVTLPIGAINIHPHHDTDQGIVTVKFDLGEHHGIEEYFEVAEPVNEDDLDGYDFNVEGIDAEAASV